MKTDIDFSKSEFNVKRRIKALLLKGADPVELCMQKWKYIIDTGDTSPGESAGTCAFCIKFNFEKLRRVDKPEVACSKCPLYLAGNGCLEKDSSYRKFTESFCSKMKYAKEMYNSLLNISLLKKGGEKLSGRTSAEITLLKEKLERSNDTITTLRNRLIDHLNYTKFAILGLIFIPWIAFTIFSFISQIVVTKSSSTSVTIIDYIKTVHDPVSGYAYIVGLYGVPILLFIAWYCAWLFWKEEYVS